MTLRPDLKVIGNGVGSTYLEARRLGPDRSDAALLGMRWFRCRHCKAIHLGGATVSGPVSAEAAECFAHEALCAQRPAGLPLTERERTALETVYGSQIRGYITTLDHIIQSGPAPDEHARAVERRGVLVGELIRIGLPERATVC